MDLQQAQQELLSRLHLLYDDREAATITDWVMEKITGWKKIDRIIHKTFPLSEDGLELFQRYTGELEKHRPVQYVLQEAWFAGMKFYVDEQVLIPRPETEELVEWVVEEAASDKQQATSPAGTIPAPPEGHTILDVGTGSGCIAIALKRQLSDARVYACDLSGQALAIAERNAAANQANIHFRQLDFLDSGEWATLPPVQVLVSNPPYVPIREKASMAPHVVNFEPHMALFVEDHDPLIFYRALADFAKKKLLPGGQVFAEIHVGLGTQVVELFQEAGFHPIILKKDMQGKDRMVKATR
jgi:release factor glutamine methyltransferase